MIVRRLRAAWHCLTKSQYILAYVRSDGDGFVISNKVSLHAITELKKYLNRKIDQLTKDGEQ
jgi:hypothetical protein